MFFYSAFVVAVTLATGTLAGLPAPGRYYIANKESGRVFDVRQSHTAPRTPVLGYPPNEGDNQKWDLAQESTEDDSGFYTFTAVWPVRKAYVNAQSAGAGVTSETFGATFNVTEIGEGTGYFIISVPLTNPLLAVTTTANDTQLTLEPRETATNLQVWSFQLVE